MSNDIPQIMPGRNIQQALKFLSQNEMPLDYGMLVDVIGDAMYGFSYIDPAREDQITACQLLQRMSLSSEMGSVAASIINLLISLLEVEEERRDIRFGQAYVYHLFSIDALDIPNISGSKLPPLEVQEAYDCGELFKLFNAVMSGLLGKDAKFATNTVLSTIPGFNTEMFLSRPGPKREFIDSWNRILFEPRRFIQRHGVRSNILQMDSRESCASLAKALLMRLRISLSKWDDDKKIFVENENLKLGHCYDLIAILTGYKNWNVLSAKVKQIEKERQKDEDDQAKERNSGAT